MSQSRYRCLRRDSNQDFSNTSVQLGRCTQPGRSEELLSLWTVSTVSIVLVLLFKNDVSETGLCSRLLVYSVGPNRCSQVNQCYGVPSSTPAGLGLLALLLLVCR